MKGLYLLLFAIGFATVGVTTKTDASPPASICKEVPTIKQLATEQTPVEFTVTNYADVHFLYAVENAEHFAVTELKGTQRPQVVYQSQPNKATAMVDTSTSRVLVKISILAKRAIPELNFQYSEGRATEYHCNGNSNIA